MTSYLSRVLLIIFFGASAIVARAENAPEIFIPVMTSSRLVLNSNPSYINDHTVFQAEDGKWHLIGITHQKVLGGKLPVPWAEEEFIHAVAPALEGPWTVLSPILQVDRKLGETHVWAPHVVKQGGQYYCFYAAGGGHWTSMINLAESADAMTWTRYSGNPRFRDFYDARDPMVLRDGDRWIMYYTKTFSRKEHLSTVAYRESRDLLHWSDPNFAYVVRSLPATLPNSQYTESPFVVKYQGLYYLFHCTTDLNYQATRVFVSKDPLHFEESNEITTLIAHAAEVVQDGERYYLTHAGWYYDGLYLADLTWRPAGNFSPALRFANSGDNDDYLVSAGGARKIRWGLAGQHALEAQAGQAIDYAFPIPEGVQGIRVVFESSGKYRVTVKDEAAPDSVEAGLGDSTLHAFELNQPRFWQSGKLTLRFEDSGSSAKDRLKLAYVKVYIF
jgi:beta-fructofuranosidase